MKAQHAGQKKLTGLGIRFSDPRLPAHLIGPCHRDHDALSSFRRQRHEKKNDRTKLASARTNAAKEMADAYKDGRSTENRRPSSAATPFICLYVRVLQK
jgi:hypothetical protein